MATQKRKQTPLWLILATLVVVIVVSGNINWSSSRSSSDRVPVREVATQAEAQKVADACGDHMQIYARNKFQTSNWKMSFVGDVKVAPPSKRGEHRGYVVAVDVDLGGGSVAKMLCGVDADYDGQRFSYR